MEISMDVKVLHGSFIFILRVYFATNDSCKLPYFSGEPESLKI